MSRVISHSSEDGSFYAALYGSPDGPYRLHVSSYVRHEKTKFHEWKGEDLAVLLWHVSESVDIKHEHREVALKCISRALDVQMQDFRYTITEAWKVVSPRARQPQEAKS